MLFEISTVCTSFLNKIHVIVLVIVMKFYIAVLQRNFTPFPIPYLSIYDL
jgi:hypothetical protein